MESKHNKTLETKLDFRRHIIIFLYYKAESVSYVCVFAVA